MSDLKFKIKHNPHGYYTLWINGKFVGNYDTYSEAYNDYIFITGG